ncbi:AbrB/MazE/SpoVT family DNA-binding domain-containing protein [Acidisphaera sp. L21]|uniref:AbrB/MazE/SpoVT family DNA-binding domain-containing protein n=1 Tax=Acidisphaera sp. L21 TaxID=1641851 RepID=UPI0020B16A6D|nr:AbrB/MazE/SpoVT family DNA-binding domain-containing protein [Acidisphaera sp. L21]
MQVAKWGNSLAIRLPADVVEILQLRAADEIEIRVADGNEFAVARTPGGRTDWNTFAPIAVSCLRISSSTAKRPI